jgi:hypothetical protein
MLIPQIPEGDRLDDRLSDRLIRARRAHAAVLSLLNIAAATFPDRLSDLVKPFVGTGIREGGPNADYRPRALRLIGVPISHYAIPMT